MTGSSKSDTAIGDRSFLGVNSYRATVELAKVHQSCFPTHESGEIKSREVELDPQESPGEIKRREVECDESPSQENPRKIKSREVELDPQVIKKAQRDQQQRGGTGPSRELRPDQEEGGGAGPSREPREDQEEGGGAGLSREPREDQEQKGGAGLSREPREDQEEGGGAGLSREPREDQKQKGGAGPPHIQESPGEIKSKEVELGPLQSWTVLCFSCSSTVAFQTLSL